jgi:hypothetical protein
MSDRITIRRLLGVVCLLGFAAPSALMSGCAGSAVDNRGAAGTAGAAGAACPLPATAAWPARCVACIQSSCPSVYADLCAANCGADELGAPCLSAQYEVGTQCLGQHCGSECAQTHGSPVPGSIAGSGAVESDNGGSASGGTSGGTSTEVQSAGAAWAEGGEAGAQAQGGEAGSAGAADSCSAALPLKCGDRLNHSTLIQGRPNTWSGYSSTQRAESGRETLYALSTGSACDLTLRLTNLQTDLDLLLVSTCDSLSSGKASSTPLDIQTEETLTWTNAAAQSVYVVVDGYAGAEGSYTLEVDCSCDP